MVLIRYGRDEVTKTVKGRDRVNLIYYEDSVWSMPRDANLRAEQLNDAGQFTLITTKRYTNAPDEHTVWRTGARHKGTRHAKKTVKREVHKEMVEGTGKKGAFVKGSKYSYLSGKKE